MSKEKSQVSTYELAVSYRASADQLLDQLIVEKTVSGLKIFPAMFLYAHAVELFLKEYLRLKGHQPDKPFRHDLQRLWQVAKQNGIVLSPPHDMDHLIPLLASGHEDYQFRYSEKSFNHSGPIWTRRDVGKLADATTLELERRHREDAKAANEAGTVMFQVPRSLIVSIDLGEVPKQQN